jgi:hypothetical protein
MPSILPTTACTAVGYGDSCRRRGAVRAACAPSAAYSAEAGNRGPETVVRIPPKFEEVEPGTAAALPFFGRRLVCKRCGAEPRADQMQTHPGAIYDSQPPCVVFEQAAHVRARRD